MSFLSGIKLTELAAAGGLIVVSAVGANLARNVKNDPTATQDLKNKARSATTLFVIGIIGGALAGVGALRAPIRRRIKRYEAAAEPQTVGA